MHGMFHALYPLVLASASPRRRLFLDELGLEYVMARPDGAEPRPEPGETPEAYAERAAGTKARIAHKDRGRVILAADTVVALGPHILGKPAHQDDALRMLSLLAGRTHRVVSAVSLILPDGEEARFHDTAQVRFHPWPEAVLAAYARTGEPMDKAGAYAVQGRGAFLAESINGSWSTVVGLPLTRLVGILLERGVIEPRTPAAKA